MAKLTFDQALKRFQTNTKKSMEYAQLCAVLAMEHFEAHGDTVYLARFYEACPDNYVRKTAFATWACAWAPLKFTRNKSGASFTKDNSETAKPFNLDKAKEKPFWEFAPDPELQYFTTDDLVKALHNVVSRFSKEDRYKAVEGTPDNILSIADAMIDRIKTTTTSSNIEAASTIAA